MSYSDPLTLAFCSIEGMKNIGIKVSHEIRIPMNQPGFNGMAQEPCLNVFGNQNPGVFQTKNGTLEVQRPSRKRCSPKTREFVSSEIGSYYFNSL